MAKLVVNLGGDILDTVYLEDNKKIYLGRSPKCNIFLDNLGISNRHAVVYKEGESYFVEDLKSTNGTIINEKLIGKHQLVDGEIIEISKYKLLFWEN